LLSFLKIELLATANFQEDFFKLFKIGLITSSNYEISDPPPDKSSELRTKFLLEFDPDFHFYKSILFGNSLDIEPGYIGRSWYSIKGFTERGHLKTTMFSGKFKLDFR